MGLYNWALRRAMGRLRITDDVVRHLTTAQRLGETVEVELPRELLPIGARTVFRAVRTRAAAQLGVDWVWPYWLQRQLDPRSPAFVPRGHLPVLTNVTSRDWTMIGTVASDRKAIVDPRGLLTPWYDGWSLDWWVGAGDAPDHRWFVPSRETAVRQRLYEQTPVVDTKMRVPGGDVLHRVFAVAEDEPLVVVEITNRTPSPIAVALAVRPYNPEGLAVIERLALAGGGQTVLVDGRPALWLPRRPSRVAASTFHDGDSANVVFAGDAAETFAPVKCEAGLAQAAFVFPLAHGATVRAAVPLEPERRTRLRGLARRRARREHDIAALPTGEAVASGWRAHTDRGMRLVLPEGKLASAVEANRRFMLLFHEGRDIVPGPFTYHRFWFRDAAYMLVALDRYGFHDEAAEVIAHFPARQRVDGFFFSQRQEWDANGAALWAMAEHWRLTGDLGPVDVESVARAARWIERKRQAKRRRSDPELKGLMPASISAEHLGPFDYFYWDDFWSLRGLRDAAALLRAAGEDAAAADAARWAEGLDSDLRRSIEIVTERLGAAALPAGPRRRIDPGLIGSLVACQPLGILPPDDPHIAATAAAVRDRFCIGPAFYQGISHTGFGTYLTLQLAAVELAAGDERALERLAWLVEVATPTFTWPEAIHPEMLGGCMGDGHHGWAAADFLSFVRNLLVREVDAGLVLCSMLPESWKGQPIEVHDAPTRQGKLSFAVRWHGDKPALLWDLRPDAAGSPDRAVTLTAPALDPTWSTSEIRGEALLGADVRAPQP
ncbi:MAG TPA: hypothetical protein VFV35_05060 [Acidimicrobiales bacterium]|nr:hypothetical protein [Acidimicrobiales bacterium]